MKYMGQAFSSFQMEDSIEGVENNKAKTRLRTNFKFWKVENEMKNENLFIAVVFPICYKRYWSH